MRLTNFFTIVSVAVTGILATPLALNTTLDIDLSVNTHYGAPLPPWAAGHEPGWYLGSQCSLYPDLLCLEGVVCEILSLLLPSDWLHCPSQPSPYPSPTGDGYTHVFSNLTGATEAGDYLTYGLVDTVADCKAMCNSIKGCAFVNTYHDVHGKGGSTQLTCSLFGLCHDSSDADNYGGQTQPDGSIDYISDSNGWCKE